MRILLALMLFFVTALPLAAQEDDDGGSFLENFLESKLSGAGRDVTVRGFEGALSSRATMEELIISDADGPWLTLRGAVLDWSRAALLRGRVQISELSAEEILLPRLPESKGSSANVSDSEATPFSLPDLPVAIEVGRIVTQKLELGEAVIGQDAVLTVDGALRLAGGEGGIDLTATRTDAEGNFKIAAGYSNESEVLSLYIDLSEGAGGIAANLMKLPGAPSLDLSVIGEGPLSNFDADLGLSTDGTQRVTGRVSLDEPEDSPGTQQFSLAVSGDLQPLMAENLRPFFGDRAAVNASGVRHPDGALDVTGLEIATQALSVTGALALGPSMVPEQFTLDGTLSGPVVLPLSGPDTVVDGATLRARFDETQGELWSARIELDGLAREAIALGHAEIAGSGTIRAQEAVAVTADIGFAAEGLSHDDPALAEAMGETASGTAQLAWSKEAGLELTGLHVTSGEIRATAEGVLGDVADGLPVEGSARLSIGDLARFAALAGRDLGGAAEAAVSGRYELLDGVFDVALDARTQDLRTGTPQLDPLLAGAGTLDVSAARGPEGTNLRALNLTTPALYLTAKGDLSSRAGGMTLNGEVRDLSLVDPGLTGPATVTADAAWEADGHLRLDKLDLQGAGAEISATGRVLPQDETLPVDGEAHIRISDLSAFSGLAGQPLAGRVEADVTAEGAVKGDIAAALDARARNLSVGIAQVDQIAGGDSTITARGGLQGGAPWVEELSVETRQLSVRAAQQAAGGAIDLSARLADLSILAPGFPGALTVDGRAEPRGDLWGLALTVAGPGGGGAELSGSIAQDVSTADLRVTGAVPLGLVNGLIAPQSFEGQASFDLALNGAPGLDALSGQVTLSRGRLAVPSASLAVTDIRGQVGLSGGAARLDISGGLGDGRVSVSGPVTLSSPFNGNLAIVLANAGLRDPTLYQTTLDGRIAVSGPLTGGARIAGRIDVGRTEVSVPSTGAGAGGAIPEITHLRDTSPVRTTRARAGLVKEDAEDANGGGGAAYPLDVVISAPSQIFVRGRGLEAELGGEIQVRGTTAAPVPTGQFDLIRGRLDILTQRFNLDQGRVSLQGDLEPYILFEAETETDEGSATVRIEGRASEPEITFSSQPELPQDEVVAQLLFGRNLNELSTFQTLQLASAIATLAGGGGEGFFGRLRAGTGLDQLDVSTSDNGGTQVAAGKYLSENLYSEVVVNDEGKSEVNLNLDVSSDFTVKGSFDGEGETGIGFFFQRDY